MSIDRYFFPWLAPFGAIVAKNPGRCPLYVGSMKDGKGVWGVPGDVVLDVNLTLGMAQV